MNKNQIDFTNIELSVYAKFVLHTIPIFRSSLFFNEDTIKLLWKYGFIERYAITKFGDKFRRTADGRMYFRVKRKGFVRFLIPVIISIIALFGGYDVYTIPVLKELLEAIASLLGNIVESLGTFL